MTVLLPQSVHIRAYHHDTAADQLVATPGTPQVVTFNNVPDNAGIVLKNASNQTFNGSTVTSGQRFVFNNPGDYFLTFVAQAVITTQQPGQMRLWWKINGTTDISGSSTSYLLTNNSGAVGNPAADIITRSMIYDFLTIGDYVELWMDSEKSNTGLRSMAPATGPTAPAIVVNIHQIGYEYV